MNTESLSGPVKVAVLVKSLGKDACSKLINTLSDAEKEKINTLANEMGAIQPELVEKIAQEFTVMNEKENAGNNEQQHRTKEEDGKEQEGISASEKNLQTIKSINAEQLVRMLKDEHPQTIAIVIAHIDQNKAGEVIMNLPDEIKSDVAYRIAKLKKIVPGMLAEINAVFEDSLKGSKSGVMTEADGVGLLAGLLNQIDSTIGGMILEELEETDPEMAEQVKQMMFVFDDLVLVDDKGMQSVLRSVETQELALALKAASEDVKEKVFKNMSERAREILKEEIDSLGAVRMKDVSDAQQNITKIIQEKESKGEVVIAGRGGDEFIG
jgi:flagellar motor switch protein FliG